MEEEKNHLEFLNSLKKYDDVLQGDSGENGQELEGNKGNNEDLFGSGQVSEQVVTYFAFCK